MWVKRIALCAYSAVGLISALLVVSAFRTLLDWPTLPIWRPDQLAQSGVLMLIFMTTAIWLQAKSPPSGLLAVQVGVTGVLLLATLLHHGFPEKSAVYGVIHLVFAIGFACWNIVRIVRLHQ